MCGSCPNYRLGNRLSLDPRVDIFPGCAERPCSKAPQSRTLGILPIRETRMIPSRHVDILATSWLGSFFPRFGVQASHQAIDRPISDGRRPVVGVGAEDLQQLPHLVVPVQCLHSGFLEVIHCVSTIIYAWISMGASQNLGGPQARLAAPV